MTTTEKHLADQVREAAEIFLDKAIVAAIIILVVQNVGARLGFTWMVTLGSVGWLLLATVTLVVIIYLVGICAVAAKEEQREQERQEADR